MKEMKAPEKKAQKMTHDGAVTENLATGEVERISGREEETHFNLHEEAVSFSETAVKEAANAHTRHRERKAAEKDAEAVREGRETRQRPSSRLQFTDEERADPALRKYIERSDRVADKLDAAKAKIPTKTVKVKERVFDEATGKGKTSIRFEEVEKKPNGKLRHNPLGRPAQEISLAAHNKVHEVEQENVGVEAGHKAEELAEQSVLHAGSRVQQVLHHHETKPWRDAAKAEQAVNQANVEFLYQKAIRDDPGFAASNPVSRYLQKKRIQRQYIKQAHQAEKTAQNTASTARSAAVRTKEAVKKAVFYVKNHSKGVFVVLGLGAIIVMLLGGVSSCTMMAGSGVSSVLSSSYLSEDSDIISAEAAYCAMPKFEYDKDYPFAAFITNLGKYNEGELVGEWVKFPTTPEEMQEVFKRIGIGEKDDFGYEYEEWFITDYDCYVDGLYDKLGEYSNIDELNYLASKLDDMMQYDYDKFCAAVSMGDHTNSIQDLINLTENLDCYEVYSDIDDDDDLGRYYLEEVDVLQIPDYLRGYIDYEAYGRDVRISEGGEYTDFGYVRDSGSRFVEFYNGDREDIPEEYRVMNFETELTDLFSEKGNQKTKQGKRAAINKMECFDNRQDLVSARILR